MAEEFTNTQYENLSYREHVRLRTGMYVGSKEPTENNIWILNKNEDNLEKQVLKYSIAMYNVIDEIIVNSIDHIQRTKNIKGKNKCDTVKLNFNKADGSISVFNNGEGIIVEKYKDESFYIPEMIFSKEMSGSNFNNDENKVSAGMNGSGSKITNILSKVFEVETTDLKNKLNYYQKFEDGNLIKNIPIVTKLTKVEKEKKNPYTKITFILDYKLFENKGFDNNLSEILDKLLFTRMNYVSIYLGEKYKVYYNDIEITKKKLNDLSSLIIDTDDIIITQLCNKNDKKINPIDINIGIYDSENNQEQISFINGLYVSGGGSHIRYINKLILDNLKTKLEKKLKDKVKITNKMISNHIFIFFSGNITNPDYKNQSKTELSISETRFKDYIFNDKVYKQIWAKLETEFDKLYLNKITKENVTKKTSKLRGIDFYDSAIKSGTKDGYKCTLFVTEGLSASSCIDRGLSSNKDLGYQYFGVYSIKGVPLNARKEIEIKEIKRNNKIEYIIDKKKKLMENERLNSLIKVLNLNYSFTYDLTEEGEAEFKTLRYGKIIIAADADLDGYNICSLLLNYFNIFFPNLFKRKIITIFLTPLIRAHPKDKKKFIEEFYNDEDYNKWLVNNDADKYNIKYIKGLAGHSKKEVEQMFKNINKGIYTFELDSKAQNYFEIYYGNDSDKRKLILSTNDNYSEADKVKKYQNKLITCSTLLNENTKEFQLDNIERKMPHLIDGLNPSRRKILAGSIKKFKNNNHEIKVFQLGGFVAEHMMYHHGSDSLNKTIINMAQDFPGSRNIPLLLPIGDFGNRKIGSDGAGAPRYIETKLNTKITNLIFPLDDNDLLEYNIIDGVMSEPKYFIPIIPMVLLEDVCLPSTGWKIELYARDLDQVIKNVKCLIADENHKVTKMKYFKNKFKGKEIKTSSYNLLVGTYTIPANEKDTIIITELPPKVWTKKYQLDMENKSFVDEVLINESSDDNIKIKIILKPGELEKLKTNYKPIYDLDYVEYYFHLYIKLSHCINIYTPEKTVKEYSDYTNIMKDWFPTRKECYIKRINRFLILLKYKIIMYENIIKFIENHEKYNLSKVTDTIADQILNEYNYIKINKNIIESPGIIHNDKLEFEINNKGTYDYLLNLSYRKMNEQSYNSNKTRLTELKKLFEYYNQTDIYKKIWNEEIDLLHKQIKHGLKNGYYTENDKKFRD